MTDSDLIAANRKILSQGPLTPGIGGALITTVEVFPGFEHSYNEWYDGDHYYAGMLSIPWCFSGSRWISTRALRSLRYPRDSAFVQPVTAGNFLNVYLGSPGHVEEFSDNILTALHRLLDEGRMHRDGGRKQVFTAHQEHAGTVYRDARGPRDFQAFEHPYQYCALEIVDAPRPELRNDLETWLLEEHLPSRIADGPAAMCLVFRTREYRGSSYITEEMPIDRFTRRIALLWMLDSDPAEAWSEFFSGEGARVDASGLGRMEYISGYRRLVAGTNEYLTDL